MNRILLISSAAVFLCSCTTILPSDEGGVPEWFETRREQVIAEGYPSLRAAAQSQAATNSQTPWSVIAGELADAQKDIEASDPGPINVTESQMRAWVAEQKALVAKGEEPY